MTNTNVVIGIDIGQTGALAILSADGNLYTLVDMPVKDDKTYDIQGITEILRNYPNATVVMEDVHSMPKQGVSSTFNFGRGKGILEGVATALCQCVLLVSTVGWKKHYPEFAKLAKADAKDKARELAAKLFPEFESSFKLKKHHNRADAVLLAVRHWQIANVGVTPNE